jgi:heavy metal translocating P-type ATPase
MREGSLPQTSPRDDVVLGAAPVGAADTPARGALRGRADVAMAALAVAALTIGALLHALGREPAGDAFWAGSIAVMLVPLSWSVVRTLARRDVGVDAIALIAMAAALAMGEYLAGSVVAVMLAGGNALEAFAAGRARHALTALIARAPRVAMLRVGENVREVPVSEVAVGDVVAVRTGEVVPVDGIVASDEAILDESTLTGEPLPVAHHRGGHVRSGTSNAGGPFDVRATRLASESAYAAMVRLVRDAERQKAPFLRMADRYAGVFLPVTLMVAGLAWALSGDAVRALAVLVVATPCPLILAAPVALVAGVSRAAKRGVVVKGAGTIEALGAARTILFDKTGTLTQGTPRVERVVAPGRDGDELLRLAASLEQMSTHVIGSAISRAARGRGMNLSFPTESREQPGQGVVGVVDGRRVAVGGPDFVERVVGPAPAAVREATAGLTDGHAVTLVAIDGAVVGAVVLGDRIRDDAAAMIDALRRAGIRHVAMATGDRREPAEEVGRRAGVDRVYSEQTPEAKLDLVRALQARPESRPVVMVGDGINDAPALALADVGIAMGSAGATVASESADAVILVDRIDRVADAIMFGRRSLYIARQSVLVGMGLSIAAMGFAAVGLIEPVAGAVLQEGIDVAVILNALRAMRG